MSVLSLILALLAAYLIGSVSGAIVLAPLFGAADPRRVGSGNPGATNAWRLGGTAYGGTVLVFDLVKGAVAVGFVPALLDMPLPWVFVCGFVAVLAHVFPVFHGFRGGKGVATAAGVLAICLPLALVTGILVFGLTLWRWRYVSLASLMAAGAVLVVALGAPGVLPAGQGLALALCLLTIGTHRANISRLRAGREPRIGESPREGGRP